jgi:hypothetical protein
MLVVVEAQESNLHEPLPPENHPYDFTTKGGHCDFRIFEYIYMSDRKKQPPIIQNLTARLVSAAPRWVLLSMKKKLRPSVRYDPHSRRPLSALSYRAKDLAPDGGMYLACLSQSCEA